MIPVSICRSESELAKDAAGRPAGKLIDAACGATKGFCIGVSYNDQTEFPAPGVHDDQEAIYVLEGFGTAFVGGQEFAVRPGTAFFVAPGVPHMIRRDPASGPVKALWAHGAI